MLPTPSACSSLSWRFRSPASQTLSSCIARARRSWTAPAQKRILYLPMARSACLLLLDASYIVTAHLLYYCMLHWDRLKAVSRTWRLICVGVGLPGCNWQQELFLVRCCRLHSNKTACTCTPLATVHHNKRGCTSKYKLQGMAQRNLVVKSFCDIPMADVEMIFPEKKVYIKPFILIQLVVTVALAIFTIVSTLVQVCIVSACHTA